MSSATYDEMVQAACEAFFFHSYSDEGLALMRGALDAAGVPALLARNAELEAEKAERRCTECDRDYMMLTKQEVANGIVNTDLALMHAEQVRDIDTKLEEQARTIAALKLQLSGTTFSCPRCEEQARTIEQLRAALLRSAGDHHVEFDHPGSFDSCPNGVCVAARAVLSATRKGPTSNVSPLTCGERSETGLTCDVQTDHGGEMHSGLDESRVDGPRRRWWTRDGKMVDFSSATPKEDTP